MAGIYIHIPFCKKACTYCDFHFTTSFRYIDDLVNAICKEITFKKDRLKEQIGSIYLGGGTPSVLSIPHFEKIFKTLEQNFAIAENAEITVEANPDDLTQTKLRSLKQLPVNRFSIGTQSFFNEDLMWMNRAHNASEAEESIKRSQDIGFENLSIDLIYGYPLLTNEKWTANINKAIHLQIPHLSAYSLTVEARTALAKDIERGKQPEPSDAQSAAQFVLLTEKLSQSGFEHYEISNYALPGKYAIHNTNYWLGVPYLGIGPAAHGFDGANRYINIAHNAKYISSLQQDQLPETVETLNNLNRYNEYVMTSLRTMWGLDLEKIKLDFGTNFKEALLNEIQPFIIKNQLILKDDKIYLTQQGKLFADGIAAELFKLHN